MAGGLGNINVQAAPQVAPTMQTGTGAGWSAAGTASNDTSSGGFDSLLGNTLGGVLSAGSSIIGQQSGAGAVTNANNAGITTQQGVMGNINSIYAPQTATGNGAFGALSSSLGLGGAPANPSNFLNMPGYQFAINQGTQALQRQATAQGSAYTPGTNAAIGQYVTGTAMQDYNTYISQLFGAAGLGNSANQARAQAQLQTGGNISQMQINKGNALNNAANATGNTAGGILGGLNSSGLFGNIASGVGNLLKGGSWNGSGVNSGSGLPSPTSYGNLTTPDASIYSGAGSDPLAGLNLQMPDMSGGSSGDTSGPVDMSGFQ